MKIVTAGEMQKIDRAAIEEFGIPGEVLMGYAGKSISDYISEKFTNIKKIVIFTGTGNNGGDGFVIAYFLSNMGYEIDVYITGAMKKVSETSKIYLNVCSNDNISISEIDGKKLSEINIDDCDLIIDAMLGTGFKGTPRGIIKDVIENINSKNVLTLSVDLPSGLPSDGEAPEGPVIEADYTITIGLPKISCLTYPGMKYIGKLLVSDIGFPKSLTESENLTINLINRGVAGKLLEHKNDQDTHKGKNGHLLLIGGFDNMEGAIILAAMAAFETGVGLATLLTTEKARQIVAGKIPELITDSINSLNINQSSNPDDLKKNIDNDLKEFLNKERKYNVLLIGPGMGRSEAAKNIFETIIDNLLDFGINRVIIDGDGLFHLADYIKIKSLPKEPEFVITPHFFEASRFMDKTVSDIKSNRMKSTIDLSGKTKTVALIKGPGTIISDNKKTYINTSGNPALATAGSGDVLSGIIGALLLKDMPSIDAAGAGAFIHGLAAELCVEDESVEILKSTDIVDYIRPAFKRIFQ